MASSKQDSFRPTNPFVTPLLNDLYQLTMLYGYWQGSRQEDVAIFDLFFRKNPFKGEYTVFAGLEECLRLLNDFHFSKDQVDQLRAKFPAWKPAFWDYLATLDSSQVKVYAQREGSVVFPRVPLLRIEGPLAVCQLLETSFLCLVNYPSLIATNAARHRIAAGAGKKLFEFGLRRAQGPDGAMSASRYAYLGGFDGTSNVAAGLLFDIPIAGTHAHSFVSTFVSLADLSHRTLEHKTTGASVDFVDAVLAQRLALGDWARGGNEGELAAFIAYAQAYPDGFLALVDTYDTLRSGVPNMLAVALALHALGYQARGIRLDSGDLAYLSCEARKRFQQTAAQFAIPELATMTIVASNDLNETVLYSLKDQGHEIDSFGIGTHLVTCKAQPALGCVYKLVEIRGEPRIKVSQEMEKMTIPGKKDAYRLFNSAGEPLVDLMVQAGEPAPKAGERVLCHHPFAAVKRVYVTPAHVENLLPLVWDGKLVQDVKDVPSLHDMKKLCAEQMRVMRSDVVRGVNPTPYKVSVSVPLFTYTHELWQANVPVAELS